MDENKERRHFVGDKYYIVNDYGDVFNLTLCTNFNSIFLMASKGIPWGNVFIDRLDQYKEYGITDETLMDLMGIDNFYKAEKLEYEGPRVTYRNEDVTLLNLPFGICRFQNIEFGVFGECTLIYQLDSEDIIEIGVDMKFIKIIHSGEDHNEL